VATEALRRLARLYLEPSRLANALFSNSYELIATSLPASLEQVAIL
jgi:hypothetical protein